MSKHFLFLIFTFFTLSITYAKEVVFTHKNNHLSGHYLKPTNGNSPKAVLIFVHGDGAMPYDAKGYYDFIWEPLRERGYAIFSWDKPNVNNSTGNWLNQSMQDRQALVLSAIKFIKSRYHFSTKNIGLIGFSQAGWVVPALLGKNSKVGFGIGIGFAKNWIEQSMYHTKNRHKLAKSSKNQVDLAVKSYLKEIEFFKDNPLYSKYVKFAGKKAMSKQRYNFVLKNYLLDATKDYHNIHKPALFLWGGKDLNVDASYELKWWEKHPNKFVTTRLISNASHEMLKADIFSKQNIGLTQWLKLMWLGQDAFAVDFLPTIINWLDKQNINP